MKTNRKQKCLNIYIYVYIYCFVHVIYVHFMKYIHIVNLMLYFHYVNSYFHFLNAITTYFTLFIVNNKTNIYTQRSMKTFF